MNVNELAHTHTYTHTNTHIHMHTHTLTHAHAHTRTHEKSFSVRARSSAVDIEKSNILKGGHGKEEYSARVRIVQGGEDL